MALNMQKYSLSPIHIHHSLEVMSMYLRISYILLICSLIATGCQITEETIDHSANEEFPTSQENQEVTAEVSTDEQSQVTEEETTEETTEIIVEETVTEVNVENEEEPEGILTETEEETDPQLDRETMDRISDDGLVIRVTWNTPNDPNQLDDEGTDIDLHLLHPGGEEWNQAPWDCYFANPNPDWGTSGIPNNPNLTIDDVNGAGPEEIVYPEPLPTMETPYQVGIDYYSSGGIFGDDFGYSTVTVSVYIHGELMETASREMVQGDFYVPFEIHWSENGEGMVTVLD